MLSVLLLAAVAASGQHQHQHQLHTARRLEAESVDDFTLPPGLAALPASVPSTTAPYASTNLQVELVSLTETAAGFRLQLLVSLQSHPGC